MSIPIAVLMSHVPFLAAADDIEDPGPTRAIRGLARVAARVMASAPDAVVLLTSRDDDVGDGDAIRLVVGDVVGGTFVDVGAPRTGAFLPGPGRWGARLLAAVRGRGVVMGEKVDPWLPSAALLPLYCLRHAGWEGPTLVVEHASGMSMAARERFGAAVGEAAGAARWAIVVAGELAPGGGRAAVRSGPAAVDVAPGHVAGSGRGVRSAPGAPVAAARVLASLDVVGAALGARGGGRVINYEERCSAGRLVAVLHEPPLHGRSLP